MRPLASNSGRVQRIRYGTLYDGLVASHAFHLNEGKFHSAPDPERVQRISEVSGSEVRDREDVLARLLFMRRTGDGFGA